MHCDRINMHVSDACRRAHQVDLVACRLIALQVLQVLVCTAPASFSSGLQVDR